MLTIGFSEMELRGDFGKRSLGGEIENMVGDHSRDNRQLPP